MNSKAIKKGEPQEVEARFSFYEEVRKCRH